MPGFPTDHHISSVILTTKAGSCSYTTAKDLVVAACMEICSIRKVTLLAWCRSHSRDACCVQTHVVFSDLFVAWCGMAQLHGLCNLAIQVRSPLALGFHLGVDQNKGLWGSYADQPQINRDPNRVNRGRVRSYATLFCAENRQNIATYLEISKDMAWARAYSGRFNNRAAIADQPGTDRGFHRHFLKIDLIWAVRLWTLLFWFFFATGYHYWTPCLGKPEHSIRLKCM